MTDDGAPRTAPHADGWSRSALVVLCVVVVVGVALGWASREGSLTVYGDDSIYLTLAKSLATGQYRDAYLFGAPPHAQYPPGMPAWLLLVRVLAGESLDAALAANWLLITLTALILADTVRRLTTAWIGVVAASVVMFNPALAALAAQLRSEIPFLAWCSLALWASLLDGEPRRRGLAGLAIGAALGAFLTRSAGIVLLPAVLLPLALQRRWRPVLIGGVISVLVIVGWFSYTHWAGQHTVGHTYAADLAAGTSLRDPGRFVTHLFLNARTYFSRFAAVQFAIPDIPNQPLDNGVLGLLLLVPMTIGAWKLAQRWAAMVMFLVLSAGVMLVFAWPVSRLLTVLLPWMVAMMLVGWVVIGSRWSRRAGIALALGIGMVLTGVGFAGQARAAERWQGCRKQAPFTDSTCYQAQDRDYVAAIDFIRVSVPQTAVIAASKPAIVFAMAGQQTLPLDLFVRTSAPRLMAPEGPVTHILLGHLVPYAAELVAPRLLTQCELLTIVREFSGGTLLLTTRSEGTASACSALTEYLRTLPPNLDE